MEKKPASFSFLFKRLNKKGSGGAGDIGSRRSRRWISKTSTGFRWKRKFNFLNWFVDSLLFKFVSICEAIFLVSKLCFFFFCCGCRF